MKYVVRLIFFVLLVCALSVSIWPPENYDAPPMPTPTTYEEFLRSLPPELLSNVAEGIDEKISNLQDQKKLVIAVQKEAMNHGK